MAQFDAADDDAMAFFYAVCVDTCRPWFFFLLISARPPFLTCSAKYLSVVLYASWVPNDLNLWLMMERINQVSRSSISVLDAPYICLLRLPPKLSLQFDDSCMFKYGATVQRHCNAQAFFFNEPKPIWCCFLFSWAPRGISINFIFFERTSINFIRS